MGLYIFIKIEKSLEEIRSRFYFFPNASTVQTNSSFKNLR
jgi:hypothetical protein